MVGPGLFETVGEEFDGLVAVGVPEEKAGGGGAKSCCHPKNIFHRAYFPLPLGVGFATLVRGRVLEVGCEVGLGGYSRRASKFARESFTG